MILGTFSVVSACLRFRLFEKGFRGALECFREFGEVRRGFGEIMGHSMTYQGICERFRRFFANF